MKYLEDVLINYIGEIKNRKFYQDSFNFQKYSFKKLGFILMDYGTILEELSEENILIVCVKVFFSPAIMAIELKNNQINIVACAKEGLIRQQIAQKAVNKIKKGILRR